ncbi:MAG: ABC transporter ATP-binding protein [Oscillospiraceae bacterium]
MFLIRWMWTNLKGYRAVYITALGFTVLCNAMYITTPYFSQKIIDTFLSSSDAMANITEKRTLFLELLAGMVVFTLLRTVLQYSTNMIYEYSSQGTIFKIRAKLFENVLGQDMQYYDKNRTGDLMTRLTGDLDMVRHCMSWIIKSIVECVALFTATSVYFLLTNWKMAICLLAITPLIFIVTTLFRKKVRPLYFNLRERLAGLNTAAQENISGNRVVKAFAREEYEKQRFGEKNKEFSAANKTAALTWLKFSPFVDGLAEAMQVSMLLGGGVLLIQGSLAPGEYVAFSSLIWTLANPMRQFGMLVNDLQRFTASANKIIEIYYARPTVVDRADVAEPDGRMRGDIEFSHVNFSFDRTEVLHDISFSVKAGETVAIMGETGSGKTALINLIPRFYNVTSGVIRIDGTDIRLRKLRGLRRSIGLATQDVLLFSDTIDGNIAFGNSDLPEEDVRGYAEAAAASEFIDAMPEGYNTVIGERGVGLSGGQKQRISLARALAIRPAVLILDDTTSAVDMETEAHIQESLKNLDFPCTKLIIAQRISSTKEVDKIIILENGRITEMGTHAELLQNKGYYYDVFMLQNEGAKTEEVTA